MKACLIWDRKDDCPPIASVLRSKASHICFLPETNGLNRGLVQIRNEQPELIFVAISSESPDKYALLCETKKCAPQSFLVAIENEYESDCTAGLREIGVDLILPATATETQLLDGVFQAELARNQLRECVEEERLAESLPSGEEFLVQVGEELHMFPKQLCDQHWHVLEQWMERDPNAVGWHLVGMISQITDVLREENRSAAELKQACAAALHTLAAGPSIPLWKGAYDKVCQLYVQEMLSSGDPTNKELVRIKQYIDENIENDVSLKRVAQEFFLSTSYLSRLFKSRTGINFSDYISARKIERAKALLEETDLSVAEISRRLNYPEQNSFSRFFKSKVGVSPQGFRAMNAGGSKKRTVEPEPVLEDFEITDFGPCAFTSEDFSFAYAFQKRR